MLVTDEQLWDLAYEELSDNPHEMYNMGKKVRNIYEKKLSELSVLVEKAETLIKEIKESK